MMTYYNVKNPYFLKGFFYKTYRLLFVLLLILRNPALGFFLGCEINFRLIDMLTDKIKTEILKNKYVFSFAQINVQPGYRISHT